MDTWKYVEKLETLRQQRAEAKKNKDFELHKKLSEEIVDIERILGWD